MPRQSKPIRRPKVAFFLIFFLCVTGLTNAVTLTLPFDERPEWVERDGIVMAGSWEPLLFRVRRDGSDGYTPTAEQREAYLREHSPEMIGKLKDLGVNFVMMHCYKGAGLEAESESMQDAVKFSKVCHDAGLRVGVYNFSGAFIWELFFKEKPEAENWVVLDEEGKPVQYGSAPYRYYWNRNHPDARNFYKNLVRFAIEEIETDLVHFDNYSVGPGTDKVSAERFREYLRETFTPRELEQVEIKDLDSIQPPLSSPDNSLLKNAWLDFSCRSLADSYYELSRYARSLRPDILVECNPGGVRDRIRPPVDHGRLLRGGEAFWDEGRHPGYRDGKLSTRIRTYKVARRMKNMAFAYCTNPLEAAESMAFNRDCLGCICWFEYADLVAKPGVDEPVSTDLAPFVRFFHDRRDLLRDTEVIADVAVLRSFPSQVFADTKYAQLTTQVEQTLIETCVPFQILYDHQLNDLTRYRCLILAGCIALSDEQVSQIRDYLDSGGRVCVVGGEAGAYDEWMRPRKESPFPDLPILEHIEPADVFVEKLERNLKEGFSLSVDAPVGLCAELTEQEDRKLVHLVNYRIEETMNNVSVRVRIDPEESVKEIVTSSPSRKEDLPLDFEVQTGFVKFTVPQIETYEVIQIGY